jgi:hypothetical protein
MKKFILTISVMTLTTYSLTSSDVDQKALTSAPLHDGVLKGVEESTTAVGYILTGCLPVVFPLLFSKVDPVKGIQPTFASKVTSTVLGITAGALVAEEIIRDIQKEKDPREQLQRGAKETGRLIFQIVGAYGLFKAFYPEASPQTAARVVLVGRAIWGLSNRAVDLSEHGKTQAKLAELQSARKPT